MPRLRRRGLLPALRRVAFRLPAAEVCLVEQQSVLDNDKSVEQVRAALAKDLGTDIDLVRFVRFERGEGIGIGAVGRIEPGLR